MMPKMKLHGYDVLLRIFGSSVGYTIGGVFDENKRKRNFQQAMETGQFDAKFPAGGLKECLKAEITGIPPDPAKMEQYLQPSQITLSSPQTPPFLDSEKKV